MLAVSLKRRFFKNKGRMKELKKVLKFINENNPYEEEITWVTLLSYIVEEIKEGTGTIKTALVNWIDKYK
jgi:hypothetical protein